MAKYSGTKSRVDAYQIKAVGGKLPEGMKLQLENDTEVVASSLLTRRFTPRPGDYWVIQEDGTISLILKRDFEEKFKLYQHELSR